MLLLGSAEADDGVAVAPVDEVSGVQSLPAGVDARPLLRAGFAYLLTLVALATLAPFRFSLEAIGTAGFGELVVNPGDIARNLLMLTPLGFLYRMSRPRGVAWGLDALVLGAAISLCVETCQLFLPMRSPSLLDVLCNTSGAWGGALLAHLMRPWATRQLAAQLSTRSPLMHGLWLLSVAIAVTAAMGPVYGRAWTCLPLGFAGGLVLVAGWRHGSGSCSRLSLPQLSARAGGWMALSLIPLAGRAPRVLVVSSLLVAAATYALGHGGVPRADGRRFELPTLRWVMVAVLLYTLMTTLYPLFFPRAGRWIADAAYGDSPLLLIEHVATLTLVGYLAAALIARRHERDAAPILVALGSAVLVAALVHGLRALMAEIMPSQPVVLCALLAGLSGGLLYCAQRRAARGDRRPAQAPRLRAVG